MTNDDLERPLRLSAALIAAGVLVQLASFLWNHPLAFVLFGVGGGGLMAAGLAVFLLAAVKGRIWSHPVLPPDRSS